MQQNVHLCAFLERIISTNHTMWLCNTNEMWKSERLHRLADWYNCRRRSYLIDKIPPSRELMNIIAEMWERKWKEECLPMKENEALSFPLVFVNGQCAGTYDSMLMLESQRRLKDLFQHHVRWPNFALTNHKKPVPFRDESEFRAIWRGHPPNEPIASIPRFSSWQTS